MTSSLGLPNLSTGSVITQQLIREKQVSEKQALSLLIVSASLTGWDTVLVSAVLGSNNCSPKLVGKV